MENVQIQNPFITVGALIMLEALLPLNASSALSRLRQEFAASLPLPPYFADSLPRLPVVNYYDNFMEPGALPLQYVEMPPDQHLAAKLFTAVTLDDSFDLPELYQDASAFFVAVPTSGPSRTTPALSAAPAGVPFFVPSGSSRPSLPLAMDHHQTFSGGTRWFGAAVNEPLDRRLLRGVLFHWLLFSAWIGWIG